MVHYKSGQRENKFMDSFNCRRCGSEELKIVETFKTPHIAALKCKKCDLHIKWLSKKQFQNIKLKEGK